MIERGVEWVPATSLKRSGEFPLQVHKQLFEQQMEQRRLELEKVAIKETPEMRMAVEAVNSDLKRLYSQAGIEISDEQLAAKIYFIDRKLENTISPGNGSIDLFGNVVVKLRNGKIDARSLITLHHELHHYVGRRLSVGRITGTTFSQTGYRTVGKKMESERGSALEEGIMGFFSLKFVLDSREKFIKRLRNDWLIKYGLEEMSNEDFLKAALGMIYRRREVQRDIINKTMAIEYLYTELMIRNFILQSNFIYGTEGVRMLITKLLRSRVIPKERRQLIDYVNSLYGREKKIGQQLFKAKFEDKDLAKLVTEIKKAKRF